MRQIHGDVINVCQIFVHHTNLETITNLRSPFNKKKKPCIIKKYVSIKARTRLNAFEVTNYFCHVTLRSVPLSSRMNPRSFQTVAINILNRGTVNVLTFDLLQNR